MADIGTTARRLRMGMVAAVKTLAVVVSLPVGVTATYGTGVRQEMAVLPGGRLALGASSLVVRQPHFRGVEQLHDAQAHVSWLRVPGSTVAAATVGYRAESVGGAPGPPGRPSSAGWR